MLEWLLKFSPLAYQEGTVSLEQNAAWLWLLFAVVAAWLFVLAWRTVAPLHVRAVSLGLRLVALLLICLPLFEPALVTPDVIPDENFVAILVDGSRSMTLADGNNGVRRHDEALNLLYDPTYGIVDALREDFVVRLYTFGEAARRTDSVHVEPEAGSTDFTAALEQVVSEFRGLPLTGIVLLTDGADNSSSAPMAAAAEIRESGIGLHVVGLGSDSHMPEREILDVVVNKGIGDNTGAEIDLQVRSASGEDSLATFSILDRGTEMFTSKRPLTGDGGIDYVTLFFKPEVQEARAYQVRIAAVDGEVNLENNVADIIINAQKDSVRVLYFEGHPRQDFKFIKRALEADQVIEFTSIMRTGTGKFYRQGIRSPDELANGFPTSQEELNQFKTVILGDVEAAAFSFEQLRLMEAFVRRRGGGFLMTGGRRSFSEGDYNMTPVADMLPVTLDESRRQVLPRKFLGPDEAEDQGFSFVPSIAGLDSPILKFSPNATTNQLSWADMPALTSINYLGSVKPGAQVLAHKPADQHGDEEPILIVQRYGKGRSTALATSSTWRWQMLLEADDARHERFWQQLVRWLAADAPNRVQLNLESERLSPGEELVARVQVFDPLFNLLPDASIRGELTLPSGEQSSVHFSETFSSPGTHIATVTAQAVGVHTVVVRAQHDGMDVGKHEQYFLVSPSRREFENATRKGQELRDLAPATYYEPSDVARIPEAMRTHRGSTSVYHAQYLWDIPILFLFTIGLLIGEWFYRRRNGLA